MKSLIQTIKKNLICKRKGHNFKDTYKESNGWGYIMHWKKCKICNYSTYDLKENK